MDTLVNVNTSINVFSFFQHIAAERKRAAQIQLEIAEQKRGFGDAAFRNWLKRKQTEDEALKKEKTVQRELSKLKNQEKKERRKKAEESFNTWKVQKDLDLSLERTNQTHKSRSLSPPARGISVFYIHTFCS